MSDLTSSDAKNGFSLIESGIILAVIGLIIGGIWIAASNVTENERVNRASSLALQLYENSTSLLHNNVENVYASLGGSGEQDIAATLIAAGGVPADAISGGSLVSPWGVPMSVYLGSWGGGGNLAISFWNISPAACVRLIPLISSKFPNDSSTLKNIVTPQQ